MLKSLKCTAPGNEHIALKVAFHNSEAEFLLNEDISTLGCIWIFFPKKHKSMKVWMGGGGQGRNVSFQVLVKISAIYQFSVRFFGPFVMISCQLNDC